MMEGQVSVDGVMRFSEIIVKVLSVVGIFLESRVSVGSAKGFV